MARISRAFKNVKEIFDENDFINEYELEELEIEESFICSFKDYSVCIVEEREEGKILHDIYEVLLIVIFGIFANCNNFVEIEVFMKAHYEWLNKHIHFENGLPSISCIKRIVGFIKPTELEEVCTETITNYLKKKKPLYEKGMFKIEDIKSMDGKVANSSGRKSSKNGEVAKVNAMSLYSVKNERCEATEFISEKTNEIPTGPILLSRINIRDCIIVNDAMSTQIETAKYIMENKGHYVFPVKGNQQTMYEQIQEYFRDEELLKKAKEENYLEIKEKRNGYLETREYIFTDDVDWLYKRNEWPGLTSMGMVKRTYRNAKGEIVSDIRYFISDLHSEHIQIISHAIIKEWSIENDLHWNLDMVFCEDDNKCFLGNSQKNLNIIRKFCLSILKMHKDTTKLSMNSLRYLIATDFRNQIDIVLHSLSSK